MERLSIHQRLKALILALGLAIIIVSGVSITEVRGVNTALTTINEVNSVLQRYAINFRGSVHDRAISLRDVVLALDDQGVTRAMDEIDQLAAFYAASAGPMDAMMGQTPTDREGQAILQSIKEIEAATLPLIDEVIRLRLAGEQDAAHRLLLAEAAPNFSVWLARINEFIDLKEARNQQLGAQVSQSVGAFTLIIGAVTLVVLGLALAGGYVVARGITQTLNRLMDVMEGISRRDTNANIPDLPGETEFARIAKALRVFQTADSDRAQLEADARHTAAATTEKNEAYRRVLEDVSAIVENAMAGNLGGRLDAAQGDGELTKLATDLNRLLETLESVVCDAVATMTAMEAGNLERRMQPGYQGAFHQLASGINGSLDKLATLVRDLSDVASALSSGSRTIVEQAGTIQDRSQRQAASLEETAATMEEISSSTRSNAQSAEGASSLSSQAAEKAEQGREVADRAIQAINEILESANKIREITVTVDSIAFQTNLLALNAAVEAARAGESGKGFAVVASEVRSLAQRASEASREIGTLISETSEKISDGVQLVEATGAVLTDIQGGVGDSSTAIGQITKASSEQAAGVEDISRSISVLDNETQSFAASARESAAAADQLSQQASRLTDLVAYFRGDDPGRRPSEAA